MCDHFVLYTSRPRIAESYFGLRVPVGEVGPRYNISPSTQGTLISGPEGYQLTMFQFS